MENIFKVREFKKIYETVQYIYKYRERGFFKNDSFKSDSFLNRSFILIRGFPYYQEQKDSIFDVNPGELVKVEWKSKEEMNRYLEQLNYTPEEAYKGYKDFIKTIKLGKDVYLKCIDTELSKGDSSEYSKQRLVYDFITPGASLIPLGITKLDFLKVFKEFILNVDNDVLPDFVRVMAYLECGCKVPYYKEFSLRYKIEN